MRKKRKYAQIGGRTDPDSRTDSEEGRCREIGVGSSFLGVLAEMQVADKEVRLLVGCISLESEE